jgi:hypothetical protein
MERIPDSGEAYDPVSMTTIIARSLTENGVWSLTEDGVYCRLTTHVISGRTQASGRSLILIGLIIATVKQF